MALRPGELAPLLAKLHSFAYITVAERKTLVEILSRWEEAQQELEAMRAHLAGVTEELDIPRSLVEADLAQVEGELSLQVRASSLLLTTPRYVPDRTLIHRILVLCAPEYPARQPWTGIRSPCLMYSSPAVCLGAIKALAV